MTHKLLMRQLTTLFLWQIYCCVVEASRNTFARGKRAGCHEIQKRANTWTHATSRTWRWTRWLARRTQRTQAVLSSYKHLQRIQTYSIKFPSDAHAFKENNQHMKKTSSPVLTSEPKYTSAPGNKSACRQGRGNKRTEAVKNVWHTSSNLCKTWGKKKKLDKSASSCMRTERRRHIKAALGSIFEDDSLREDLDLGNRRALNKPQNEPPIKRLAKTLSPLERNSPPWLRS